MNQNQPRLIREYIKRTQRNLHNPYRHSSLAAVDTRKYTLNPRRRGAGFFGSIFKSVAKNVLGGAGSTFLGSLLTPVGEKLGNKIIGKREAPPETQYIAEGRGRTKRIKGGSIPLDISTGTLA